MVIEVASLVAMRHYPYAVRTLLDLYNSEMLPNVRRLIVEPEYGRTARLEYCDATVRLVHTNDVGLNSATAAEVANDKGYTKFFLQTLGYNVPAGAVFVLPWYTEKIKDSLHNRGFTGIRTEHALLEFLAKTPLPVYVKPVNGSHGHGIYRCETSTDVADVLRRYETERTRALLIEEAVPWPDYRLVILQGELISAYSRRPLAVTGDGTSSVSGLIHALQSAFDAAGRDTRINIEDDRIDLRLARIGHTRTWVPPAGEVVQLLDVSNLSAGGFATDVTSAVAKRWTDLARRAAKDMSLDYCGVDLACSDIRSDDAEYSILEINAAPGLDHYAAVGHAQTLTVRNLYRQVFNAPPGPK